MKTIREIRQQLDDKEISAIELTEQFLDRIKKTNSQLNSFITITEEQARKQAAQAQKDINNGTQGRFTGIPYAAKDLFCTKGIRTTAGSKILNEYIPPYSATAIERCRDAVLLGKTNLDEFAMGSSNEYSVFGPCKNPYDLTRVSGGSSGGSAVAVASGQTLFAFGTDTGGSIRQPASFCNVVGFKPTYGRISRYGVIALASSLDTVGLFTRNIDDMAYVLQEVAGSDGLDSTALEAPTEQYSTFLGGDIKGLRIGIPKEYMEVEGFDPRIKQVCTDAIKKLEQLGASIAEISLPNTKYSLPAYYVLNPAEASSNLARYDGMQYGKPAKDTHSLEEVFLKTREEGFGAEVKRRIMIGTFCLSSGYYDAYYKKAQQVRTLVKQDFDQAFEKVDIIFTPVSPFVPFKIGERMADPIAMYLADIFTIPADLAATPALSLPAGFIDGLPTAVQIIAPQFQEGKVLQVSYALEQALALQSPALQL
ncbi:MAG TPA: Asp-tRNA(Asn)/Glu-tRNA(Gln) amidotransferase subunit GatA [Patescibacteria group bacterium]|nr:Asp-tRNA(Asn)/Glu-tRNA(Gln) amidotransferase subunit GatA [Patescibacteria group bacterium]